MNFTRSFIPALLSLALAQPSLFVSANSNHQFSPGSDPPVLCYVSASANGANNGTSWTDAYTDLQSALGPSPCTQVWVAIGTYRPTSGSDRHATFQLKTGVALYGGFAAKETLFSQRDPAANVTILSGDLLGDDVGSSNVSDNTYHVVTGQTGATLDGFTITAGNTNNPTGQNDSRGAGMLNISSDTTVTNVIFSHNVADGVASGYSFFGGGMYNDHSSPILTDVTFRSNLAQYGGGMYNDLSSPVLMDVTFSDNSANNHSLGFCSGSGGGIYNNASSPTLTNVTFFRNIAGVILNGTYCGAGGGIYGFDSNPMLTNVTFNNNIAGYGGGIYTWNNSSPLIRNAIFWGDLATKAGMEIYVYSGGLTLSDSVVQGGYGGGTAIITADPLLGLLGDYGGFTQTVPLQAGSSAIDVGNKSVCPVADQRGVVRPQGAGCDIGAFEYSAVSTPPTVVSSVCSSVSPTLAASVDFTVTFSEPVLGVGVTDFSLTTSGISGAVVTGVSGSGSLYTVTVNTGSGSGSLRLDLPSSAVITDLAGNPLADLPYTGGQTVAVIKQFYSYLPRAIRN